jgi:hypothetical protein
MANSCDVKFNTINKFRELKLIEESGMKIISSSANFNETNKYYSQLAKDTYQIENQDLLFYLKKEEKKKISAYPIPYYRVEDIEIVFTAIPNEIFFESLQRRFYEEKEVEDLVNLQYNYLLKNDMLPKVKLPKFIKESKVKDPELVQLNNDIEEQKAQSLISSNSSLIDFASNIIKSLKVKNIDPEGAAINAYYKHVINSYENQSMEGFTRLLLEDLVKIKKQESKSINNITNIKTDTSFPDIDLEC